MVSEIPIAASDGDIVSEFQLLVDKFDPVLVAIGNSQSEVGMEPVREAIQSLQREIGNAKSLITSSGSRSAILTKQVDEMTQVLGRSLGLVLFAGFDLPVEIKEGIAVLHREVMHRKFATSLSSSPTHSHMSSSVANPSPKSSQESSAFINEFGSEIVEQGATLSTEDVALQLKYGDDEHFLLALLGLQNLIRDEVVDREWIDDEGILVILFNRLGSTKVGNRLATIQTMRSLALKYPEIKDRIGDAGNLQLLVKSLMRNVDECREAVGLLLELSKVSSVRRRIGKVQGCIVLLVATLNRDDPVASSDAAKLLESLSSNVQNALHMAEAGYFKALVHHLKEVFVVAGSDMSKILMATSLSRMELTDQTRSSIGGDGAIEPLVKMFKTGKFEAKLSALNALHNLSRLEDNVHRLISSGIVVSLLQLLFSVTSVLMSLREPASAILATIAESESILVNQDIAQQMLSLLNLSSPVIQCHLLKALKNIASHSGASNVREKMKENGAIHLLLPFLTETNIHIRAAALNFLYTLSQDSAEDLMEHLGEYHLGTIINLISSSGSDTEKAVAIGILSNIPAGDKKATEILRKYNLLPILISLTSSSSGSEQLAESIAGVFIRFTMPSDKKLQLLAAELGLIPLLVKLLSSGSSVAKQRAATSLAQLSQNTLVLSRSRISKWKCMPPSGDAVCKVHDGICSIKRTFCLVKACAIPPLIQILMEKGETEVEAVAAVLSCLATIVQDETWEKGSSCIAEMSGVQGIVRALECKDAKAQEKALWILERIFRNEAFRAEYGGSAQVMLIDLAQNGDPRLKSAIGKVLAQLELLQFQSSYF